jgi:flagellar biosynthetic protein FlhB
MAGERTEAPTPKKLRDARQRGDVAKSQEIVSIGVLLVAVAGIRYLAPMLGEGLRGIVTAGLTGMPADDLTAGSVNDLGRQSAMSAVSVLLPLFAMLVVAAVAFNVAQTGLVLSGQKLKPKFSHVNPLQGLKRIFAMEGLVNLIKALVKMAIVTLVVWLTMSARLDEIATLGQLSIAGATATMADIAFDIAFRAAGVLFVLTLADYAWQRRRHFGQLRMTVQEVRQEHKESEGDPHVKAAIRRRRQALLNRMIAAVPKADVVVTNPTHYAVAIKYDPVSMRAPVVVAKGQRLLAQRIKDVARKNGVPVLEEPPLARALFSAVQVGHPIPANLFHAVAEVLAWVYSLRARARAMGARTVRPRGLV